MAAEIRQGDCLDVLRQIESASIDLVYLDPPFFTQKKHVLSTRDRKTEYSFEDQWNSISDYASFLHVRLMELHRVLKPSGSIFFHCDKKASHVARTTLDDIFSPKNFGSEIIWHYRRWSSYL